MNFIESITHLLKTRGDAPAVQEIYGTTFVTTTAHGLLTATRRARVELQRLGVKPGDRVALLAPNSARWIAADLAILSEGAVCVPLYSRQEPSELREMLADSGATILIAESEHLANDVAAPSSGIHVVLLDALVAGMPQDDLDHISLPPTPSGREPRKVAPDAPATIIYTSGTSGAAKGVVLTVRNFDAMIPVTARSLERLMERHAASTDWSPARDAEIAFHYLPFCFAGSRLVLFTALSRGIELRLSTKLDNLAEEIRTAAPHYVLNVPALLDRIRRGVETKISSSPRPIGMLYRSALRIGAKTANGGKVSPLERGVAKLADSAIFANVRKQLGGNLACLICGSAPLSEETQTWFQIVGIPVYQVYGLTETTGVVTMDEPGAERAGYVGAPVRGVETRVTGEGELEVRGESVFAGYWNRQDATDAAFNDGWFRTGDCVDVDDKGRLRVLGRANAILVPSSGHNVAPEPIEAALAELLPKVGHVVAIGHGRPFIVALLAGVPAAVTAKDISLAVETVNNGLPHYRRIRSFHATERTLTSENGLLTANQKLRRRAITQQFAAEIDALYSNSATTTEPSAPRKSGEKPKSGRKTGRGQPEVSR